MVNVFKEENVKLWPSNWATRESSIKIAKRRRDWRERLQGGRYKDET